MRRKKLILLAASCAALLLLVFFGYPVVKLEVISRHYDWYGSYVILPRMADTADEKPAAVQTRFADYDRKGIKLTNVLYYPGLRQLAFGYVYGDEKQEKYEIALLDSGGQSVPGVLLVSGGERFRARHLQKLNFMLDEPLRQRETYTILVTDENGERAGALDFVYE